MDEYLELLKRRFGTKRVHCNIVYQEYIAFRDHVHMNSTQWETLTDFVKWLGREGMNRFCLGHISIENLLNAIIFSAFTLVQKSYCCTPGGGVRVHMQNVWANVKVLEFQSFCIFSCIYRKKGSSVATL